LQFLSDYFNKITVGETENYKVGIPFHEVMADGIYRGMSNGCMVARKRLLSYEDGEFPLADAGNEGFKLLVPKIPFRYWEMVWNFYRDVNEEYGAEAAVLFYWNHRGFDLEKEIPVELRNEYGKGLLIDGDLIIYVPKQRNSKALTEYHGDKMRIWLGQHTANYLDTHSHNTMSAFFSGTDDANERLFQFYSVFGRIGIENTCIMRYRFQDSWENIDVFDVFEEGGVPQGNENLGVGYPITWWDNVEFPNNLVTTRETNKTIKEEGENHDSSTG